MPESFPAASPPGGGHAASAAPGRAPARAAAIARPAADHASGALSTVALDVVHGGYVAAGVAMRNLGYGTVAVTGIPAGAKVRSAILMWDILADADATSFRAGSIDGHALQGADWASGASPCWPASSNFSFEADVTKYVSGNGKYSLTGFASGESDGADPATQSAPPLLEGASLIVVYDLKSMPQRVIQIGEGATEVGDASATAAMNGFLAAAKPQATATWIVADGQTFGAKSAAVSGSVVPGLSFDGSDPQAAAKYEYGSLWDTQTADISSDLAAGSTSADLSLTSSPDSTGSYDCLVWVGQVVSVRQAQVGIYSDFKKPAHTTDALNDGWTLLANIAGLGNPKSTPDDGYTECGAPWVGATGSDVTLARQVEAYNKTHVTDVSWVSYWTAAVPPVGVNLETAGYHAGVHAARELREAERAGGFWPTSVVLDFEQSDTGGQGHPSIYSCGTNRKKGQDKPKDGDKQCWRWVGAKTAINCFDIDASGWKEFSRGWARGVTTGIKDSPLSAAIYVSPYEFKHYDVATYNVPVVLAITPVPVKPAASGRPIAGYAAYYAKCGAAQAQLKDMASWDADFSSLQFTSSSLVCAP